MKNSKTLYLVEMALLVSIIILMAFTPIGYLRMPGIEITFIMIPVVIGSVLLGEKAGAVLGGVFGITSFIQCFGMSQFGAALLAINPFLTFILCMVPRILMGYLSGLVYKLLRNNKNKLIPFGAAALTGPLTNTLLFVGGVIVMFGNTEFIMSLRGGLNVIAFFAAFVGINGVIEAVVSFVVSTGILTALKKYIAN
ncbi:MAG: ECF transporter S component [Anaerofustis stercorihominis]|nr:ECF transporter S component [Anaerofustis stercorihominis]